MRTTTDTKILQENNYLSLKISVLFAYPNSDDIVKCSFAFADFRLNLLGNESVVMT